MRAPSKYLILLLIFVAPAMRADNVVAIGAVLDDFHQAAADADFDRYTSLMATDIVFLGTDAGERWQGEAFTEFARPHFENGKGWDYQPQNRRIQVSGDGAVAWFDELLSHEKLGTCRGSGVLVREEGSWRVAQYNLSVPIPNELVYGVADQIQAFDAGEVISTTATAPAAAASVAAEPGDVESSAEPAEPEKQCRERRHKTNRKASC